MEGNTIDDSGINLFREIRTRCKIISKLTTKTPERQNYLFGVLIVNLEQIIDLVLVLFYLTLNM